MKYGWLLLCVAGDLTLLTASCAAPPPPLRPSAAPAPTKAETIALLTAMEKSFYSHWGAVESTPEYPRLGPAHAPVLREIADANGETALMALRVLARLAPQERFTPAARAILYATAFEREQNFTRWGVISPSGFLPGVYGDELLKLGPSVAPFLQRSLVNTRRAWVLGGEGERSNRMQADRVCDYAWVFLATIFDRPLVYHADPRFRDPQINELDLWLDRHRQPNRKC